MKANITVRSFHHVAQLNDTHIILDTACLIPWFRAGKTVHLDESDISAIDSIHKQEGKHRSLLSYHNKTDSGPGVFGWSYEQLGWPGMREGGLVS